MSLAPLGLEPAEEAVYRAVLRHPEREAAALAGDVGQDPAEVARHVHSLVGAGLLRRTPTGPRPERPDLATAAALARAQQELTEQQDRLVAARREVNDLVELYVAGSRLSDDGLAVERIEGPVAIRQRLDELTTATRAEFWTVNQGVATPEELQEVRANDRPHVERGVQFRSVVPSAFLLQESGLGNVMTTSALGEQYRVLPDPPLTFVVADRVVVVVPLDPDDVRRGALFVRSPGVVRAFAALFEATWAQARPVFTHVGDARPDGLETRERRLLELLATGSQDETVARHLGLGVRTVRRDVARLMDRLGARSRFEAGVLAAGRGWL